MSSDARERRQRLSRRRLLVGGGAAAAGCRAGQLTTNQPDFLLVPRVANRLLRHLLSPDQAVQADLPEDAILVARNLGPGELMDLAPRIRADRLRGERHRRRRQHVLHLRHLLRTDRFQRSRFLHFLADDVIAEFHAFITDEYRGTGYQLADFMLALAAKGTVEQLAVVALAVSLVAHRLFLNLLPEYHHTNTFNTFYCC